jgi:hypothetical protein
MNHKLLLYNRRWVITKLAQQIEDMSELIDNESLLVKQIAEVLLIQNFHIHSFQLTIFVYRTT